MMTEREDFDYALLI